MFTLKTFTPSEAARISGVNVGLQRDWRRRGILPALETPQAMFSPFEVARMMALGALASQGLSPLNFKGVSVKLGASIVYQALLSRDAFAGAFDEYIPVDGEGLSEIEEFVERHNRDGGRDAEFIRDWLLGWKLRKLAVSVTRGEGHSVDRVGAFVQFAEGSFDFFASAISAFEEIDSSDPRMRGALIVIGLDTLGRELRRLGGALVSIDGEAVAHMNGLSGPKAIQHRMHCLNVHSGSTDADDRQEDAADQRLVSR